MLQLTRKLLPFEGMFSSEITFEITCFTPLLFEINCLLNDLSVNDTAAGAKIQVCTWDDGHQEGKLEVKICAFPE